MPDPHRWFVARRAGGGDQVLKVIRAVTLAVAATVLAAGCGGSAGGRAAAGATRRPSAAVRATPASSATPASAVTPSSSAAPRPSASLSVIPVPPPPGNLHQTSTFPNARSRVFRAAMTDLWIAVLTGKARFAAQTFFPVTAYEQVKAIGNPVADWQDRLFADFRLDVGAAHHLVGGGARLLRVIVPSAQAAWVDPGACYNSVGYWHVAGARMLYQKHGRLRSIGIASLISWRGRWYVVHFGAVERSGSGGYVDAPAAGAGVPGPPGGC